MREVTYGSVCSGIEAATTAWHPLGWSPRWFAEIEPFPCAVLAHHWPQVPNLGDFTAIRHKIVVGAVEAPDVLVGGTPCQAFSVAGLRQSLDDKRGQLTLEFVRLADAIDSARSVRGQRPVTVVWENVPGVLNTPDNAFGCFLAGLVGEDDPLEPPGGRWTNAGYVRGPRRAVAWRILDAQYFGVAQRRRRVFIVASAGGVRPEQVLFELDGVRRDSTPSREAGKIAPTIPSRSSAGGGLGTDFDLDGGLVQQNVAPTLQANGKAAGSATQQDAESGALVVQAFAGNRTSGPIDVSPALNACGTASGRQDFETEAFIAGQGFHGDVARTLTARHDSSPCADRGMDVVAFQSSQSGVRIGDTHATLDANNGPRRHNGAVVGMQVRRLTPTECERLQGFPDGHTRIPWPVANDLGSAQCLKQVVRATVRTPSGVHFVATNHVAVAPAGGCPRAGMPTGQGYDRCRSVCGQELHAEVRAIRLAGKKAKGATLFLEGHTYACESCRRAAEDAGIVEIVISPPPSEGCPDGPRYKALGNSMAVPVMRWIGKRIAQQMEVQV